VIEKGLVDGIGYGSGGRGWEIRDTYAKDDIVIHKVLFQSSSSRVGAPCYGQTRKYLNVFTNVNRDVPYMSLFLNINNYAVEYNDNNMLT